MEKRVCFLGIVLLLAWPSLGRAQDARTITGTVTSSEDGSPLPGTSVLAVGTESGTATDGGGAYTLDVPASADSLRFSFVGFMAKTVAIAGRSEIDVALLPDFRSLDEVVVVGYGSQLDRDVTGNISRISAEDIADLPTTNIEQALQGRAPGVVVQQNNGKLGQGISVQVRGISSVSAGTEPLYVVDGIPVTTTSLSSNGAATDPLADLNSNDIASIEILKDAAASAIYGARGSNGVVLITTKNGSSTGDTEVTVDYRYSTAAPTNQVDFLNAEEYVDLFMEAARNSERLDPGGGYVSYVEGIFDYYSYGTDWRNGEIDTDWQGQAFDESAQGMNLDVSANGGDEDTQFYVSGSYLDEEGILIGNGMRRITGRVNVNQQVNDWLEVGGKLSLGQTLNERVSNDNSFATPIQLVAQMPINPAFAPKATPLGNGEYVPSDTLNDRTFYYNGMLHRDNVRYDTKIIRSLGNAFAGVQLLPDLRFRSEFGLDLLDQNEDYYANSRVARSSGAANGSGYNTFDRVLNYTTNNFFNYTTAFADEHDLDATVGFSFQSSKTNSNFVEGQNFPNDAFGQIASAAEITGGSSSETSYRFLSYFGRANYKFLDRYLFTVSGRTDASSRFGSENRYGFFPAASVGWIVSDESFLQDHDVLSFFKLRGSAGVTGNADIPNFASRSLYGAVRYTDYAAIEPTQLGNEELKWERTTQYDLGLEFGLLDDRITGDFAVYLKNTSDLLLAVNVPTTTGFATIFRNVGDMRNRGFEAQITSNNIIQEGLTWRTTVNLGINRNEITDLGGQVIEGGAVNRAVEGEPIGVFYALDYAGVDPENGDALYYVNERDEDGNIVDPDDTTSNPNLANRVVIGSPLPDFTGGLRNRLTYAGFDLNLFFQFSYGSEIYDGGGRFRSASADYFDNQTADQLDAWEEPGDQTDVPEARLFFGNGTSDSDRYLYDGSYLRLRNLTLGYSLPSSLSDRLSLSRARLYVTGFNLLTFTDYKLWDPEVNADYLADDSNVALGTDFYSSPQARKISAGIQFSF